MALVTHRYPAFCRARERRGLAALACCLMLGACAQTPKLSVPDMLANANAPGPAKDAAAQMSELAKATQYWGREYAKNPRQLKAALNYARDLKAMGEKRRALAVLQQASVFHGRDRELASEYGRLALDLDQIGVASRLLAAADDPVSPDWRVISARGTALAKQGKYRDAIPYYERALTLARDQPSILSNLALAHAMSGQPAKAERLLRQAAAGDRSSLKIRQNLALVLGLQGKYDEAKRIASRDLSAEKAAKNTDYLRRIVRLEPKRTPKPKAEHKIVKTQSPEAEDAATKVAAIAPKPARSAAPANQVAQQPIALPVPKRRVSIARNAPKTPPQVAPKAEPAIARVQQRKPRSATDPKAKATTQVAHKPNAKPATKLAQASAAAKSAASHKSEQATKTAQMSAAARATETPKGKPAAKVAQKSKAGEDHKGEPAAKIADKTAKAAKPKVPTRAHEAPVEGTWTTQVALSESSPKPKKER